VRRSPLIIVAGISRLGPNESAEYISDPMRREATIRETSRREDGPINISNVAIPETLIRVFASQHPKRFPRRMEIMRALNYVNVISADSRLLKLAYFIHEEREESSCVRSRTANAPITRFWPRGLIRRNDKRISAGAPKGCEPPSVARRGSLRKCGSRNRRIRDDEAKQWPRISSCRPAAVRIGKSPAPTDAHACAHARHCGSGYSSDRRRTRVR